MASAVVVNTQQPVHPQKLALEAAKQTGTPEQRARARMSRAVQAAYDAGSNDVVELLVAYRTKAQQAEVDRLIALGAEITTTYDSLPMLALRAPASALLEMAMESNISVVDLDAELSATSDLDVKTADAPAPGTRRLGSPAHGCRRCRHRFRR